MKFKTVVGIDEVGRGPIAGPVAVCALALGQGLSLSEFKGFRDSKKLSHKQRLKWLEKINQEKKKGNINYKVCFESNKIIDTKCLSFAIKRALTTSLKAVCQGSTLPQNSLVLLDGGLRAPVEYKNQKTIIKGDEKELAIALASIVAKVTRDSLMVKIALKYPQYGFEKHKGYGTCEHYKNINKHGLTPIHRKSFLKKLSY